LTPKLVKFLTKITGVISFLNHEKNETRLPDPISAETVKNFFSQIPKKSPVSPLPSELNIGDLVRITEGSFANQEGKITYLNENKSQVKVDLDFLGRKMSFNLPIDSCQKIL
jgi:transcription antitermination factor NusG